MMSAAARPINHDLPSILAAEAVTVPRRHRFIRRRPDTVLTCDIGMRSCPMQQREGGT